MKKFLALLLSVVLVGCSSTSNSAKSSNQTMTLHIIVEDKVENETLYDDDITVNGSISTLADFLEKADELDVEMEDGQYGKTILGMCGLKTEDWNTGPWWLYESENNEACQAAGSCPAASELEIQDGDTFTFTYTDSF